MQQVDISEITALTKDRDTSIRLYRSCKRKNPLQSPQWVVEKVISDLQRDRGVKTVRVPHIRTRNSKRRSYSYDSYWYGGLFFKIKKGSWADRNRNLIVTIYWLSFIFLKVLFDNR